MIQILERIVKEYGWNSIADCLDNSMYQRRIEFIEQACKEYARLMCDKQKEICQEESETEEYYGTQCIVKETILNAPYPDEIQ